jgi:hypothetical protein
VANLGAAEADAAIAAAARAAACQRDLRGAASRRAVRVVLDRTSATSDAVAVAVAVARRKCFASQSRRRCVGVFVVDDHVVLVC